MRTIFICLLATAFFASCSSGSEIRFLGSEETVEVPEDFFLVGCDSCVVGDTVDVFVNPAAAGTFCLGKTLPSFIESLREPKTETEMFIRSSILTEEMLDDIYPAVIVRKN